MSDGDTEMLLPWPTQYSSLEETFDAAVIRVEASAESLSNTRFISMACLFLFPIDYIG
jgi:hypothetical protein